MDDFDEEIFECEYCDIQFYKEELFRDHMLEKHDLDIYAKGNDSILKQNKEETGNAFTELEKYQEPPQDFITDMLDIVDPEILSKKMTNENEAVLKLFLKPLKEQYSKSSLSDEDIDDSLTNDKLLVSGVDALVNDDEKSSGKYMKHFKNILNKKRKQLENESKEIQKKIIKQQTEEEFLKIINKSDDNTTVVNESELSNLYDNIESDYETIEESMDEILRNYENNGRNVSSESDEIIEPKIYEVKNIPDDLEMAKFECFMCDELATESYETWRDHINSHYESIIRKNGLQKRQICPICFFELPRSSILEHVRLHLDHKRCPVCHDMIPDDDFNTHYLAHTDHHKCGVCGEVYKSIVAVRKHACHHRKGVRFLCPFCDLEFAGLEKMVHHISFVHKIIDFSVAECPYCLELTDEIKNHCYSTDKCKFKCKVCLLVLKEKSEFVSHMMQHFEGHISRPMQMTVGSNTLLCDICKHVSINKARFRSHKKAHLLFEAYKDLIPVEKLINSKTRSTKKSNIVYRQRRVKCEECQMYLPQSDYEDHLRKHKLFKLCSVCFEYISNTKYDDHMETFHSGDDHELTCDICGENGFESQTKLENHCWCHTRKIQRPCGYCSLMFSSELSRVKHVSRVHKSIAPGYFECYHCFELLGPKSTVHLLEPAYCLFRCKICNARHYNLQQYEKHLENVHDIKID